MKGKLANTVRPPAPRPSTPAAVRWLSLVSLLNDVASEMIYPLLPSFLVRTLSAGPAFLGLVEGIAESTSSFLKLASGWLSDRFARRKPLVVAGYGIAAAVRPLIAVAAAPWHVLALRFTDRVGKGVRTAPRDALLAESVAPEQRGRAFGLHRAADHAGAFIGPLVASGLLLLLAGDVRLVFGLAAIPGILAVVVVVTKVRETQRSGLPPGEPGDRTAADAAAPRRPASEGPAPHGAAPPTGIEEARPAPHAAMQPSPQAPGSAAGGTHDAAAATFRRYLLVLALFTLGNATDAFLLLRAGDLGVSVAAIPLLWAAHHAAKSGFSLAGGALADRWGARATIVAGWLVYAGTYVAFAFATTAWHVWALFLVYGLFYGLTEAPEKALVAGLAAVGRRGAAFGAYHFTAGMTALPASVLFGLLWNRFGPAAAFLTGAVLSVVAALLLPFVVPRRLPEPQGRP